MTPEERTAWLEERRTGIGGSDAAASVGLSKYKTRLELYLDKRGELETAENEPMRWGHLLEPVVRQEYCNRTGRTVVIPPGIVRHPTVEFALMTPDGIADESRVLQVKTSRTSEGWGEPGSAEIPQEYLLQTQHEMFVTGLPVADVAVLIGGSDFRIYVIDADAEFQSLLIEQEREFWELVKSQTPPEPLSREDIKRRWRTSSGLSVVADETIEAAANALAYTKAAISLYEGNAEELAAIIQGHMKDAAELRDSSGASVLATWKNIKATPRFDLERFKKEQPELHRQYLRDAAPQRRFLLKVKGSEVCPPQLPNALAQTPKLELAAAE